MDEGGGHWGCALEEPSSLLSLLPGHQEQSYTPPLHPSPMKYCLTLDPEQWNYWTTNCSESMSQSNKKWTNTRMYICVLSSKVLTILVASGLVPLSLFQNRTGPGSNTKVMSLPSICSSIQGSYVHIQNQTCSASSFSLNKNDLT